MRREITRTKGDRFCTIEISLEEDSGARVKRARVVSKVSP
jgi:hypothetical protein